MTEQELEDDAETANTIFVYECSEKHVGVYYDERSEDDLVFQSIGDTRDEVVEDMIETLSFMPQSLAEVQNDEADLVDVVPLERSPKEESDDDD